MIVSIVFAVIASAFFAKVIQKTLKSLDPAQFGGYKHCAGGWWEAKLNNCNQGLVMLPQQPVNTYSNLAYLAVGLFLAIYLEMNSVYVLAITCIYLCAGSALYHATSTWWAGSLDVSGIYAVFTALAVHSANTYLNLNDSLLALIMFVLASLMGYNLRYKFKGSMELKIAIFLLLIYLPAAFNIGKPEHQIAELPFYLSISFFVLGFACWFLDKWRKFPFKRWGHGFWHILTAGGIGTIFYANFLMQSK